MSTASDRKIEAEIAKLKAEAKAAKFEAKASKIELERKQISLEREWIELEKKRDAEKWSAANDGNHGFYYFNTAVNATSVTNLRSWINSYVRAYPESPIEIGITSGGGSVYHGYVIGDCIAKAQDAGTHVTVTVEGLAGSMAGVVLQYATDRVIGRNSVLHLHEASQGMGGGKASEMEDDAKELNAITRRICDVYAKRAKKAIGDKAMTGAQIHKWIKRRERLLTAEEAVEMGFADRVG